MSLLQYDERFFGTTNLRKQEEVALERAPEFRVCIEVMPNSEFPKEVLLMNNEGIQTRIPVEYEWVLVPALCGVIGHKTEHCKAAKKKAKQVWVQKSSQNISNPRVQVMFLINLSM
ncbi:hypothetical protein Salat_2577600 [Sesamum alatum]|uniref:Uncharacterized protein n=1 Tax=Sesamum alatum TaxID=300844 RepID=A0AAE2CA84_9LAMI|nr:hypothetical protein Salat_2577600 [Sesamum alatum]